MHSGGKRFFVASYDGGILVYRNDTEKENKTVNDIDKR